MSTGTIGGSPRIRAVMTLLRAGAALLGIGLASAALAPAAGVGAGRSPSIRGDRAAHRGAELVPGGGGRPGQGDRPRADRPRAAGAPAHRPHRARRDRRRRSGGGGAVDQASASGASSASSSTPAIPTRVEPAEELLLEARRRDPSARIYYWGSLDRLAAVAAVGLRLRHRRRVHRAAAPAPARTAAPAVLDDIEGVRRLADLVERARQLPASPSSWSSGCPTASASRPGASPAPWSSGASSPG